MMSRILKNGNACILFCLILPLQNVTRLFGLLIRFPILTAHREMSFFSSPFTMYDEVIHTSRYSEKTTRSFVLILLVLNQL